jgi:hypothetical protein
MKKWKVVFWIELAALAAILLIGLNFINKF